MRERKPFDPALRELLDAQAAAAGPPPTPVNNQERVYLVRQNLPRALQNRGAIPGLPNEVETREAEIKSGLRARIYSPPGAHKPRPFIVYTHGGGWVAGSIDAFDPFYRLLSKAADVVIASVEYRLAPEHPYPAGLEDTLAAANWASANAADWGGDPTRIALGGDSAGANLAAAAANRLCAHHKPDWLRALLMLYPVTDHPGAGHRSYEENAVGYGLEATLMRWFWEQYLNGISPRNPEVSILQIDRVPSLPPTLVATAEYDVLRDEGIAYAGKLRAGGVEVTHLHSPDMSHNFPATPGLVARFPQSNETLIEIANWLKSTLSGSN